MTHLLHGGKYLQTDQNKATSNMPVLVKKASAQGEDVFRDWLLAVLEPNANRSETTDHAMNVNTYNTKGK